MKSLLEIIAEKGQDYEKEEINVDPGVVVFVDTEPVVLHAVLERTAVVYGFHEFNNRRLVKLGDVMARQRDIRWRPRNLNFLSEWRKRTGNVTT